ncbi:MAG: EscR/YscR/HrcR family type III secretion system export apparatus protein [Oligoflexia bacterium]|nr:EscR/YscR/HrcR family type III secretion system export apparatus protein [Oligoflexia bacterium]
MNSFNPLVLVGVSVALALLPVLVGVGTCYLKLNIVLGMLRNGLGTQSVPGNMLCAVLALALTAALMGPVVKQGARELEAHGDLKTLEKGDFSVLRHAAEPWRQFMLRHVGASELQFAAELNSEAAAEERSFFSVLLAFTLSELKESFAMGLALLLPFLVIDLVVSNILAGLGMFMMSPVMISVPLKLLLFVSADGWLLLSKALVSSYGVELRT